MSWNSRIGIPSYTCIKIVYPKTCYSELDHLEGTLTYKNLIYGWWCYMNGTTLYVNYLIYLIYSWSNMKKIKHAIVRRSTATTATHPLLGKWENFLLYKRYDDKNQIYESLISYQEYLPSQRWHFYYSFLILGGSTL